VTTINQTPGSEPTVWRNGVQIEENHLSSKGLPQADVPAPAPLDEWTTFEGSESNGLQVRWLDGKKQYRAVARIDDESYSGERGPRYSKEYEACDDADVAPVDAYSFINPGAEMARRQIDAAVARRLMRDGQAAPSDMRLLLREMEADLTRPYFLWQQARQRHADRMGQTATLRAQIAVMLEDIEADGMTDEYKLFIDSLQKLLQMKGKSK